MIVATAVSLRLVPGETVDIVAVVGRPLQVSLDAVVVLGLLFMLGLYLVYRGFRTYQIGRAIRDTATETVRAVAVGRTELVGEVTPADTVLSTPFTEGECVYATYRIEEEREDEDGNTSWATIDHDTWVTDFVLDDGTGAVRVAPEIDARYEISDANTASFVVPPQRSEPSSVARFLEQVSEVEPTDRETRRYVESVIPPGEEVYVLGGAAIHDAADGGEGSLVIGRDAGSGRFLISDMPEGELTETLSRRAPMLILLGLGMSVVSLYFLLTELGLG